MPPEIVLGGPSLVIQVNLKLYIYLLNSAAILITFLNIVFACSGTIYSKQLNKQTNNNDNYRINNIFFFSIIVIIKY